ncbi:hypothetical protein EV44_g3845 [Erysiphe necator]|uniref:Uncharacterized protein n=1 Tax=Uncinula necator TaxID=52586 RepID=A0A0B1PCX7_UNCNE|nr:hypothetical protein EV44_g3845 [Erysiphe necator]
MIDSGTDDDSNYAQYLADYEENELDSYISEDDDDDPSSDSYEFMQNIGAYFTDASFIHRLTGEDVFTKPKDIPNYFFTIDDRFTAQVLQGIMPDSGALNLSTISKAQYLALKREDPSVHLKTSNAGQANIQFGPGKLVSSIGAVNLVTAIGNITFHILNTPTRFLLCLKDMENLKVNFNNITNELVQGANRIPLIRKWGHAWFHLRRTENA